MTKRFLCRVIDVPPDGLKECEGEDGTKVLIASSAGEFFAYQAQCPHQEVPLCEGIYDGSTLICNMHLWQWDIRTGDAIEPAESPLRRFPIYVEGGRIFLKGEE